MLIPALLIIYFSFTLNTNKVTGNSLTRIDVADGLNNKFSFSDKEDLNIYLDVINNSSKASQTLRDIDAGKSFEVKYSELSNSYDYVFYVDKDTKECYFKDAGGNLYKMKEHDAEKLSLRAEFSDIYDNGVVPNAVIDIGGTSHELSPSDYQWEFKSGDNILNGIKKNSENEQEIKFKKDNSLALSFEKEPDNLKVALYNGEHVIFDGDFSDIPSAITYTKDTPLSCEIEASWYKEDECDYSGSAKYSTNLFFDVPATWSFVDSSLSQGEFTIIKFENLNDDENINISSELPLPDFKIQKDGDTKFAFVPISFESEVKTHSVVITSNDSEKTHSLRIRSKNLTQQNVTDKKENITDATRDEFLKTVEGFVAGSSAERLWDSTNDNFTFACPIKDGKSSGIPFGSLVYTVNLSKPYYYDGVNYAANRGTSVMATARGKVVFADELTYSGKTVIIDHGFGVLSIYQDLDSFTCSVDDIVSKGQEIGLVGQSKNLHFCVYMDGIFINPVSNYIYGIKIN